MTEATTSYATWHTDPAADAGMTHAHAPYWRHFIETLPERDLSTRTVLDFGYNRGGFLRLLHALRPFRHGIGVDIASESVAVANAASGDAPLQYEVTTDLTPWAGLIDLAFSYEVIYLLPDLAGHARQLHGVLRPGGSYYAVTGCHTESPLWPRWRALIASTSNAPVQDYAPDHYVAAFVGAGFAVSVRRFGYDGFVRVPRDPGYYPSTLDALAYPAEHKLLFRLDKLA